MLSLAAKFRYGSIGTVAGLPKISTAMLKGETLAREGAFAFHSPSYRPPWLVG